jgi:hypothetical protein
VSTFEISSIARRLRRDEGIKQRILQRSPRLAYSMDAEELGAASARELAARELKELGIEVGEADPIQLLDAHHAGRKYALDRIPNAGALNGGAGPTKKLIGEREGDEANKLTGSSQDAGEGTFLDKYLEQA